MELQELYRGRLIDHIQIVVKDLQKSRKFYDAVFEALEIPFGGEGPEFFFFDEFCVSSATSPAALGKTTGRIHVAFQARDEDMVKRFHAAGLRAGGSDNGGPGIRERYHPGYFGAFLCDPESNNIEAVFHGKAERSADAVKVTF